MATARTSTLRTMLTVVALTELMRHQSTEAKTPSVSERKLAAPDFLAAPKVVSLNPIIDQVINRTSCLIAPSKIPLTEQNHIVALCNEALSEILKENTWIPKAMLIRDVAIKRVKVFLTSPENLFGSSSIGMYEPSSGTIWVAYNSAFTKEDYKHAMLNEIMSHVIVRKHETCKIHRKAHAGIPFLGYDGNIDNTKKEAVQKAIKVGTERFFKLVDLWEKKKNGAVTHEEAEVLEQFLRAAKSYHPKTFTIPADESFQHALDVEVYQQIGEYIEPGPRFPSHQPFLRGKIKDGLVVVHHTKNTRSALGRAQGFCGDFIEFLSTIQNPRSPYATQNEDIQIAEMMSFIFQFPQPILNFVFPELLAHMDWYLSQCPSASSSSPPRKTVSTVTVANAEWVFQAPPSRKSSLWHKKQDDQSFQKTPSTKTKIFSKGR